MLRRLRRFDGSRMGRMPFLRVATIQSVGPQSLYYGTRTKHFFS